MKPRRTILIAALALAGCDTRTIPGASDGATNASGADAATANGNACPYPDGVCDFDTDCPGDRRCEGAMHTTGTPHAFVCRGICVPRDMVRTPDAGIDTGIGTDACIPPPGPAVWATLESLPSPADPPPPNGILRVRLRNAGCTPIYRWVGCCNEGVPLIETRDDSGSWVTAQCDPTRPRICCDMPPECVAIEPGEEVTLGVPELEACECGEGAFRAKVTYFIDDGCAMLDVYPVLTVETNAMGLICSDPMPPQ